MPLVQEEGPLKIYRPESEWHRESHQMMEDFLRFDDATKAKIYESQLAEHRRKAARQPKKRGGSKHGDSPFLLSGILREATSGLRMTGMSKAVRRYHIKWAHARPKTGDPLRRTVSALPIETPVRQIVGQLLKSYTGIATVTQSVANTYFAAKNDAVSELPALRAERDTLLSQIDFWVTQMRAIGTEQVTAKTVPLRDRLVAVGKRIAALEREDLVNRPHMSAEASTLEACLSRVAEAWDQLPNHVIKHILRIVIRKMEINFHTDEVELELQLPSWAALCPSVFTECLEKKALECHFLETPVFWAVPLGSYRFLFKPMDQGGMILLSEKPLAA
jgi:hypothetical protein